ncbi:hypothetical protein ACFX11_034851 [Malus domestica]
MRAKSVVPDGVAYNTMIVGLCKIRKIEIADILKKDFKPEGSTMDMLIRGLYDESRVLEALNVMSFEIFD